MRSQQIEAQKPSKNHSEFWRPYLGLEFVASDQPQGLRVTGVYPHSASDRAGVKLGDVIVSMNAKAAAIGDFSKQIWNFENGEKVQLKILRSKSSPKDFEVLNLEAQVNYTNYGGGPKVFPEDWEIHPEWENGEKAVMDSIADQVANHYRIKPGYQDLRKRLFNLTRNADPFRLKEIAYLHRHPFRLGELSEKITDAIKPTRDPLQSATRYLREANRILDHGKLPEKDPPALKTGLLPAEHIAQLREILERVDTKWKEAYSALTAEEMAFLYQYAPALAEQFEGGGYIYADSDFSRRDHNFRVISLASKINYTPLIHASLMLLKVADRQYVEGLKKDLKRAGLDLKAQELLREKTPFGDIVIAGTSDNWHKDLDQTAILIDLGGNDFYSNRAGSSHEKLHASIVVDAGGNDHYESNLNYAQASGFLGIGIIADLGGNDSYVGLRGAQGSSLMGVGLLIDAGGDDVYRAHTYAQGSAFFGVAGLIDLGGNDRYESHLYSQAVGIAGGVGALIDSSGKNSYFAKGYFGSGYGTPGTYNGWSQGVGIGLRSIASGGMGILYDGGEQHLMEAGDFSQGGGYYFGWGILKSAGHGDDTYIGSRYAQGFSAHYAFGSFIEEGGNDTYLSQDGVATGIAMDLSASWFEDKSGNDHYSAKNFSCGSSAHNAIAVFIDRNGKDIYEGPIAPATGQGNDYHGGISLSLVFNLGRPRGAVAKDQYSFTFALPDSLNRLLRTEYFQSVVRPISKQ